MHCIPTLPLQAIERAAVVMAAFEHQLIALDAQSAGGMTPKTCEQAPVLKTREQVRNEFRSKGLSISAWAVKHGFNPALVTAIINDDDARPARKCLRGDSHNIAVALGIKSGEVSRERLVA
ncbi:DNA-binding protein [Comamonas kerstersii]|uniref:DNA-binding protein n=1 Tax=Comamonas kerstersii TaxID=225992 RepID=UPI003EE36823